MPVSTCHWKAQACALSTRQGGLCARPRWPNGTGHNLVVLKASVVDAELEKLDLKLRMVRRAMRMVSPTAYEAGGAVGASLTLNPGILHQMIGTPYNLLGSGRERQKQ